MTIDNIVGGNGGSIGDWVDPELVSRGGDAAGITVSSDTTLLINNSTIS